LKSGKTIVTQHASEEAAWNGNLEILEWLLENGLFFPSTKVFSNAASRNNFQLIKWLYEIECPWDENAMLAAIYVGNMEILDFLEKRNCPWPDDVFLCVAKSGNIQVAHWLLEKGRPLCNYKRKNGLLAKPLEVALECGYYDLIELFQKEGLPLPNISNKMFSIGNAAIRGDFLSVKKLHEMGCPWGKDPLARAQTDRWTECSNREMMSWMIENGCPLESSTACSTAISYNNFGLLKWLCEKGCPLDELCMFVACSFGEFEMLIWLNERTCPANKMLVSKAAIDNSQFEILKWLINNGFPAPKYEEYASKETVLIEIKEYLEEILVKSKV
jgi:hypothetical protein